MTYKDIVDAVLADGFAPSKRASAQLWVQFRHAWLWDAAEWTFKYSDPTTVTFTSGSNTVATGVTDFSSVESLYDSHGYPIVGIRDHREFFNLYNANYSTATGSPEAYTVINKTLYVGPKGDGTTGLLIYEKSKPTLSNDNDTTGLPDGYDLALVHGGKAEGFKLANVPLWQSFDEDFTAAVNALERDYLNKVREQGQQFGAYRPGGTSAWY